MGVLTTRGRMALVPGTRLGPYEILQAIGAGGMGEVYRARHTKLQRDVAIKILPPSLSTDPGRLLRFEREARTASALNHPGIVTIYDIGEHAGTTYIAMELVAGRTLRDLIVDGPLPIDQVLRLAVQLAEALARAHESGIVHRDIKPANIMVTADGVAKILDFGLAKGFGTETASPSGMDAATFTEPIAGMFAGTPYYMAPEQLSGREIDHRADQFAFGVLLYEMFGGRRPFDGPSLAAVMSAILMQSPPVLRRLRPAVPAHVERVILRCLEKEPDDRYPTTTELSAALRQCEERRTRARYSVAATLRRPAVAGTLGVLLLAIGAGAGLWVRDAGSRWAERDALDEITRLVEAGAVYEAYRTALDALHYRPADPQLQRVLERITLPLEVTTVPPGAEVSVKGYATPEARWERLGETPLSLRIPYALMRWRITRDGYEPFEGAPFSSASFGVLGQGLVLDTAGSRPSGAVRVPGGPLERIPLIQSASFLTGVVVGTQYLDRFEVTNREYREFIDAGGYDTRRWWPPFVDRDGHDVAWQDALDALRDATGRYGPASWELGRYPAGEAEYPVGGISWYEAAAYCAFAGRSLPTIYHWYRALGQEQLSDILVQSNMGGTGKAAVGAFGGLGAYGTYDMAGNVREWVWNAVGPDRYILGGAWNEPGYLFRHVVAQDPWNRDITNGARCTTYPEPPAAELLEPVVHLREFELPEPLTDEAFELLRGMYAYDRIPLDALAERVNDSLPDYRREVVSIRTAYDGTRMEVNLLIPHDVAPPYQSVIWFPGDDVFLSRSSESFVSAWLFDFIPRGGRVIVYPVYKGMYERFEPWERTPSGRRDMQIRWAQDLSRTIDYLETRDDFDTGRIAYYGFSGGAVFGPVMTAIEPRIGASILLGGGLVPVPKRPEADPFHFAPRSRVPTLMINGFDDFIMPLEAGQLRLFELLGAGPDRKRHARLPGGHIPSSRHDIVREVLDWLDRHFGPVRPAS